VLDGCGFCPFAVADLLRCELASASAATPARRRGLYASLQWLRIGVPGSYQFTTTLRTVSLNHKPPCHDEELATFSRVNCRGGSYGSPQS